MIIDKVLPYWTDEERQRLAEIRTAIDEAVNNLNMERRAGNKAPIEQIKALHAQNAKEYKLYDEVETRYIKATSKKAILDDVRDIVNAIEKEDFLDYVAHRISELSMLKSPEDAPPILRKLAEENFENCYEFILYALRVQLNAIGDHDEDRLDKVRAIVEKRVALWYVKQHPDFLPMAHGKATDAFALMSNRDAVIDRITGNATIDRFGVQLAIAKLNELHATLGVSTDKLLSTAIATFTQQNDFRHTKTKEPRRDVSINLKEYAQLLGYDVEEHETGTPDEAEREKTRAKNQLDNARKAIKKDLDILQASTLTWEEPIKQSVRNFDRISLVTRTKLENGHIRIWFTPEIAGYLAERNLITQYPTKLLRISGRQPTAYYIGRKLSEHYNIDNNVIRGTNDRISIPSLLKVASLDSYEEVQKKDRGHWVERIKEPLEKALDTLTQEGVLRDWKYTHAKGVDLTEEEAYSITSYEEYEKLYLHFTPADKVDHTERIEAKQEARAEARRRKNNTTRKKKS